MAEQTTQPQPTGTTTAQATQPPAVQPTGTTTAQPQPEKKSVWKKWWLWTIIVVVVLAILGAGVWFFFF